MNLRISINVEDMKLREVGIVMLWCYRNLEFRKDFNYSDEVVDMFGNEVEEDTILDTVRKPHFLYFNSLVDLTALSLATGIKL